MRRTCLHLWEGSAEVAEVMFCVSLDCFGTCHRKAECHALLQTAWQLQQTRSMLLQRACQQAVHLLRAVHLHQTRLCMSTEKQRRCW